jgi:molybdenum cofactor synthesis domain-containing protein
VIRVAILTISDSVVAGRREDQSGPALEQAARKSGWTVAEMRAVSDEVRAIAEALIEIADGGAADVILTTGGTGVAPRDVTPEATRAVAAREIAGFGERMREEGRKSTPFASLSRGGAATRGQTLIVNLPGSPKGAVESLQAVMELIPHAVDLLHGRTEHKPERGA